MTMRFIVHSTLLICAVASLAACGSDDADSPDGAVDDDGPLYAMTIVVPTPDGASTSYLITTPSLSGELDPGDGIEGRMGHVYGIDGNPAVWVVDDSGTTVNRWTLGDDGALGLDQTISVANLGIQDMESMLWQGRFASPELHVFSDNAAGDLVRWNPSTMELEGALALELPGSPENGYPQFWESKLRPDGTIVTSWLDDSGDEILSGTLVFNEEATEILGRDDWALPDGRQTTFARGGMLADGTVYAGPTQSCDEAEDGTLFDCGPVFVNRVLPDASEYDREWQADLSELTGLDNDWHGNERIFHVAGDDVFFALQLGSDVVSETKWFVADAELSEASEIDGGGYVGDGSEYAIAVDGRVFIPDWLGVFEEDWQGNTPVYEITEDGLVPTFSIAGGGQIYNIVRIR